MFISPNTSAFNHTKPAAINNVTNCTLSREDNWGGKQTDKNAYSASCKNHNNLGGISRPGMHDAIWRAVNPSNGQNDR